MIQRLQTLYLILVVLLSGGLVFILNLWKDGNGKDWQIWEAFHSDILLLRVFAIGFWVAALLALFTIFLYKKRKIQITLNRLNILINFTLLGILGYLLLGPYGQEKNMIVAPGSFLPLLSLLLLILANRAIQKDENLVRSSDRLR